ncbi:hypothetical protein EPN44_11615 [bacterium]|nr:MAG: hypothetical protein EPN44_11615 [bacterium]
MIDWNRIEGFIGYGRLDAPVVFIGLEEGLRNDEALEADLLQRSCFAPVMDLEEAHRGIAGAADRFSRHARIQTTWRAMCHLMLRRGGMPEPTVEERRGYQAVRLGRSAGETLLAELLPYPKPALGEWPRLYQRRYRDGRRYRLEVLPKRLDLLTSMVGAHRRELVVCYGRSGWKDFGKIFSGVAAWTEIGPYRIGHDGDTRILFTRHFADWSMRSEASLQRMAEMALHGRQI